MTINTHNILVRQYLAQILDGSKSVDEILTLDNEAALEAVSVSSRVFNDVTHAARDIYGAMTSPFEARIKAGKATYELLYKYGLSHKQAVCFLGKTLVFKIDWEWSSGGVIFLAPQARLPEFNEVGCWLNGLRIPLGAIVQNSDAWKCREVVKWVNARKTK